MLDGGAGWISGQELPPFQSRAGLIGRGTKLPPQFGHTPSNGPSAQSAQYWHWATVIDASRIMSRETAIHSLAAILPRAPMSIPSILKITFVALAVAACAPV